ncbi:MAG TPA: universal stress protein [Bryobacteraceae bacterium]|nr:universal stress protein [Bryobacteraceae bacterium]
MVQRFRSKLTLMHVIQIPTGWYGGIDGGCPILFDVSEMEEAARNKLNVFLAPSDGVADKVVKVGDPAAEVLQFAEQNQVDLVVMPTHGYGKFRNLLLGSVTAKVLHDAKCPVWTAAHTEDPAVLNHFDCKDVIGAIDLTPESAVLIRRYAELAREFNAKLRLVHAVPGANPDTAYSLDFDFRHFLLQAAREKAARLQAEAGTNLEVCLEGDAVSKVVRAAALHHDADLVLLGRGTMPEKFGQLRTNACAIIRDAPCPILSV